MTDDHFDPLSALSSHRDLPASGPAPAQALADFVDRNPLPAVLTAAAAGAGVMALLSLMSRQDADQARVPRAPSAIATTRGLDFAALVQQMASLTDRLGEAVPTAAAKQQLGEAGDAIAEGWGALRQHALDAVAPLSRFEPQATAALKVARENPVWTALLVGALGAVLGSQLMRPADERVRAAGV